MGISEMNNTKITITKKELWNKKIPSLQKLIYQISKSFKCNKLRL